MKTKLYLVANGMTEPLVAFTYQGITPDDIRSIRISAEWAYIVYAEQERKLTENCPDSELIEPIRSILARYRRRRFLRKCLFLKN